MFVYWRNLCNSKNREIFSSRKGWIEHVCQQFKRRRWQIRRSLVENSSTPQLFLGLIPEIIVLISWAVVGVKKKEEEILEELGLDFRFKGLGGELSLALN